MIYTTWRGSLYNVIRLPVQTKTPLCVEREGHVLQTYFGQSIDEYSLELNANLKTTWVIHESHNIEHDFLLMDDTFDGKRYFPLPTASQPLI